METYPHAPITDAYDRMGETRWVNRYSGSTVEWSAEHQVWMRWDPQRAEWLWWGPSRRGGWEWFRFSPPSAQQRPMRPVPAYGPTSDVPVQYTAEHTSPVTDFLAWSGGGLVFLIGGSIVGFPALGAVFFALFAGIGVLMGYLRVHHPRGREIASQVAIGAGVAAAAYAVYQHHERRRG